jgi:hypothetical protein
VGIASDPVRRRVVAFDGASTYEWDGTSWNLRPRASPADFSTSGAPCDLVVATDAARNRAVFFGQHLSNEDGTWEFDGAGWILATPAHTPDLSGCRSGEAFGYDPIHRQTVLYGGVFLADTWTWNGNDWTDVTPATSPTAHHNATIAFDGRRMILFGGVDDSDTVIGETWAWDGSAWSQLAPAQSPSPRSSAALGYDPIRDHVVMFGGYDSNSTQLDETWLWDGTTWTMVDLPIRPLARAGAAMAWDAHRQRLVLFGGVNSPNDSWEWTGSAWARLPVATPPFGRPGALLFGSVGGGGVFMYGGTLARDLWQLRWDNDSTEESCTSAFDLDGDGLAGCADPDCWYACAPMCSPGTSCDPAAPRCGDGVCDPIENCRVCPGDCTCAPVCGDFYCDPGETKMSCPGDC